MFASGQRVVISGRGRGIRLEGSPGTVISCVDCGREGERDLYLEISLDNPPLTYPPTPRDNEGRFYTYLKERHDRDSGTFDLTEILLESEYLSRERRIKRATKLLEWGRENCSQVDSWRYHWEGYAERGYSPEDLPLIVTGNYNSHSHCWRNGERGEGECTIPERLGSILERLGVTLEWGDEWTDCDSCNRLVRTVGDSYSWKQGYSLTEGGDIYCPDCTRDDLDEYLESLVNNPLTADTLDLTEEEFWSEGYFPILVPLTFAKYRHSWHCPLHNSNMTGDCHCLLEWESGMHRGQDDDPREILSRLRERYEGISVVFQIPSVGQFDLSFVTYVRLWESDPEERETISPTVREILGRTVGAYLLGEEGVR